MHQYKKLDFWQRSCNWCEDIYKQTALFPESERFGLTGQIRRVALSIPLSIAEGASRNSNKDFMRFLRISLGSAFGMETQLLIANPLNFMNDIVLDQLSENVGIVNSPD